MSAGGNKHSLTLPLLQTRGGPDSPGDGAWQGALAQLLAPPLHLLDLFSILPSPFSLLPSPLLLATYSLLLATCSLQPAPCSLASLPRWAYQMQAPSTWLM